MTATEDQRIDRMLEAIVQRPGPWVVEQDTAVEDELTSEELDDLYQRFLALDESKMPEPGAPPYPKAPQVKKDQIIYSLSRINYRSTCASIALHLSWGEPLDVAADVDELAMWLGVYEHE